MNSLTEIACVRCGYEWHVHVAEVVDRGDDIVECPNVARGRSWLVGQMGFP